MVLELIAAGDGERFREALRRALLLHQAQRHAESDPSYRHALALMPAAADPLRLYGLLSLQRDAAPAAVRFIGRAISVDPAFAGQLAEVGQILLRGGRAELAASALCRALGAKPERADWRCLLATALIDGRDGHAASPHLRVALVFEPAHADAHYLLAGLADAASGARALTRALAQAPMLAAAHYNLANRLIELGRGAAAECRFKRAIALEPALVEALNNLSLRARTGGRLAEAIRFNRRALAIQPFAGDLWLNLGSALQADQQLARAVAAGRSAIALSPGAAEGLSNTGTVAQELGHLDIAGRLIKRALSVRPLDAVIWNNLANALTDIGQIVAAYRRAVELDPGYREAHSNLLFAINYLPGVDSGALFDDYRRWADRHARPGYTQIRPHGNSREPDRPLRIGYLSADFRSNPISYNMIGLIEERDPAMFQAYCYAEVPRPDQMTERWGRAADGFRFIVGLSDGEVADLIRADRIDILVCLGGHTAGNRVLICSHKPAPVQMSYGDLSTTGLETMDYWLTDEVIHPPDTTERFTEELLRLPVLVIHEPPPDSPDVGALPALAAGSITFGSFNNLAKLNDVVLALWAEVLSAVPKSRLMLKYVNWLDNHSVQERVRAAFTRRGIARDRLILAGERLSKARHLQLLNQVDIALDPFPFNGCTTSFEALWMGVPLVTLAGERWLGRMGLATLSPLGLDHLAAASPAEYVARAAGLAADLPALAELRAGLRRRVKESPLCDAAAYARSVESVYRQAWRRWAVG